jgi:hypothetical protein
MRRRRIVSHLVSLGLHLLAIAPLLRVVPPLSHDGSEGRIVAVMTLSPPADAAPPPGDSAGPPPREESPGISGDAAELYVGGFTFDIDKIARRRDLLFPFITGDLAFERMANRLAAASDPRMTNPYAAAKPSQRPPLVIAGKELQRIVDRAWSRRDRWQSFSEIRSLIDRYDGQSGGVPLVLGAYLTQNILQPYYDAAIPDPRVWVMLGLSADHIDFIDFVAAYVRDHPSTRTATELLFLLDKLVQGSRDALLALLALDPTTEADFTRQSNRDAFTLLFQIQQHYRRILAERGLVTPEQVVEHYDQVRLTLLRAIVATTPDGYLTSDARFLAGAIAWHAGRDDEAIDWWSTLRPASGDMYYQASSRLRDLLDRTPLQERRHVDPREIKAVLDAESGRWLMSSFDRLKQFGYRFETY